MADLSEQPVHRGERASEGTRNMPVFVPAAEIYETQDALVLTLEMPGVDPESVNLLLEKRVLTVSGRGIPAVPKGLSLVHGEFQTGAYERSFTLSEAIDGDRIEAVMRDGVLRVTLPKTRPAPAKTISVRPG